MRWGLAITRRGLFIGRFQPFHLGHLKAVEHIMEREDYVIIGIGSAQYSHTLENPLTVGERIEIIHTTLRESGIDLCRVFITPIPDIGEHRLWVSKVESFCPRFQTVYSNNTLVRLLFEEAGYEVREVPLFNRENYMAREIRRRMLAGEEWRSLVHPMVCDFLASVMEKRLRKIASEGDVPK